MVNEDYNPEEIETHYMKPNHYLMESKELPQFKRDTLKYLYKELTLVLQRPDMYDKPVERVQALEYSIQILWGFIPSKDYHSYWYWIDGCTCPKLDGQELTGTSNRIVNDDCKWHNRISESN